MLSAEDHAQAEAGRRQLLADAEQRALRRVPDLDVTTRLITDEPGRTLVRQSEGAALVVVGTRGVGGIEELVIGSVGLQVAGHARCPVMLVPVSVRDPAEAPTEIVVGVDELHPAEPAVGWAYAEADLRDAQLTALYAVGSKQGSPGQQIGEQQRLSEALAGWTAKYPDLPVTLVIPEMKAGSALISASKEAGLVVVGARRRHGGIGMALGRVNHAVLHHARCPVVVVPEP